MKLFKDSVGKQNLVTPYSVLSTEPIILVSFWSDFQEYFDTILGSIPDHRRAYMVIMFNHHRVSSDRARMVSEDVEIYKLRYPNVEILFLCNSDKEKKFFDAEGLQCIYCHGAAFLDESLYHVDHSRAKEFDIVYKAEIEPHNRHELAIDLEGVLLVGSYNSDGERYFNEVMDTLQTATFKRDQVGTCKILSKAKVGICLGNSDGDIFSCAEYLLSGLKVVTTDDYLSNDFLYKDDYVFITDSYSTAVAKVVKEALKVNCDPYVIREDAIQLLVEHRQRFIKFMQGKCDRQGNNINFSNIFESKFTHLFGLRGGPQKSKSCTNLLKEISIS